MNGTSNATAAETDNGLTGGPLFLVVLTVTSAWCVFIMCVVCCSEYRGYQRRGLNRHYERRSAGGAVLRSTTTRQEGMARGVTTLPTIQQELSTMDPSEDITDSSIERKDEKSDIFNDYRESVNISADFPTPKTRKSILPPINVSTIINVECHSDTSSPSKEMLLDSSSKKLSQLPPVIIDA